MGQTPLLRLPSPRPIYAPSHLTLTEAHLSLDQSHDLLRESADAVLPNSPRREDDPRETKRWPETTNVGRLH